MEKRPVWIKVHDKRYVKSSHVRQFYIEETEGHWIIQADIGQAAPIRLSSLESEEQAIRTLSALVASIHDESDRIQELLAPKSSAAG